MSVQDISAETNLLACRFVSALQVAKLSLDVQVAAFCLKTNRITPTKPMLASLPVIEFVRTCVEDSQPIVDLHTQRFGLSEICRVRALEEQRHGVVIRP